MAVDFINSNIALFGTDLEKKVKETAAACEKMWQTVASGPTLRVWRIEKFHVCDWPIESYGQFHTGDSYIILKRYGPVDHPSYDVYFWLGDESTIDERGTAAYKTVELDTFLKGLPVEHREEQGKESDQFKSLFGKLIYLPGGVESGFHHVAAQDYKNWKPIIHDLVDGKTAPDPTAVSILDAGRDVFVYEGPESKHAVRLQAAYSVFALRTNRPNVSVTFGNDIYIQALGIEQRTRGLIQGSRKK